ncbi:MAG TPA: YkgJ family cysteine cluster protein [Pseudonocardiaceae bacterium]|nr:YkgJ family cysteine cluster protein [Pseudonocardiaceae bacterium]
MTEVPTLPTVDWAAPAEDPLDQLERQVVRGSHFTQAVLDKLVARLANTEAYLAELVAILRAQGVLAQDSGEVDDADEDEEQPEPSPSDLAPDAGLAPDVEEEEPAPRAKVRWPGVAFRVDPTDPPPAVEVNCAERMPICHAVCCKLGFALTPPEVEAGKVKWDLGFPYMIRHETNGYCSHNDTTTGRCSIYADRPSLCRRYSCAGDTRIWKDFEAMELNEEWIRKHLADRSRILLRTDLPGMEVNSRNGSTPG